MAVDYSKIQELLGEEAETLLSHVSKTISKDELYLPGGDFVDRVVSQSDRNPGVMRSMQTLFDHGRLAGTGYLSILPVDQGIEHSAGASFAPNPQYFDPENIVKLAIEGGCNAVASTFGVLGRPGGERLLAVALTRARRSMVIVTCFKPTEGPGLLRSPGPSSP
mgnify:CR=1 FL=1